MQGGTGGLYFASNALIPDYLHAIGRPDLVTAGLSALNLGQLPASLLLLLWARRLGGNKGMVVAMQLVGLAGIAALSPAPGHGSPLPAPGSSASAAPSP